MTASSWTWSVLWDAPATLPALWLVQGWLRLGWALVLSATVLTVLSAWARARGAALPLGVARGVGMLALVWCALPGTVSPAFWLGLAFQSPSLAAGVISVGVLAALGLLGRRWMPGANAALTQARRWAGAGALLGWVLLLDTFAIWPLNVYPLGFGAGIAVVWLAGVLAPWAWRGGDWQNQRVALVGVAVWAGFVLTRLPSGNAWDALLDPWLMLLCHGVLLQDAWRRYRK